MKSTLHGLRPTFTYCSHYMGQIIQSTWQEVASVQFRFSQYKYLITDIIWSEIQFWPKYNINEYKYKLVQPSILHRIIHMDNKSSPLLKWAGERENLLHPTYVLLCVLSHMWILSAQKSRFDIFMIWWLDITNDDR